MGLQLRLTGRNHLSAGDPPGGAPHFAPPYLGRPSGRPPCFDFLLSSARPAPAPCLIELDGDNLRREPLAVRKATLASVLAKANQGIRFNDHIQYDDGEIVFRHACKMGLEGIVSKRKDSPYHSGRSSDWLKRLSAAWYDLPRRCYARPQGEHTGSSINRPIITHAARLDRMK